MVQGQQQTDNQDILKKAEIKTMQADILAAQKISDKNDLATREREMARKITEQKRAEEERKKIAAQTIKKTLPTQTKKIDEKKVINDGEEAIKKFEADRRKEESDVIAKTNVKIQEEQRKKEIAERKAAEERRLEEEKKQRNAEKEKLKQIEEARKKEIVAIRQREEAILAAKEARRIREREILQLEEEKILLEKGLQDILSRRVPLETEINQLAKRESQLQENLNEVSKREDEVEREVKTIEAKEKSADTEEKKKLEQQRWEIEEKRRRVEKERWEWEAEIGKVKDQKREVSLRYNRLLTNEEEILERKRAIADKQEEIKIENEKIELEKELQRLKEKKSPLEIEINAILERESQLQAKLDSVSSKENDIEREISSIEDREKSTGVTEGKKELEQQRWEIEEKRRGVEKERWEWEAEIGKVKDDLKRIENEYQKILLREKELLLKLHPEQITNLSNRLEEEEKATIPTKTTPPLQKRERADVKISENKPVKPEPQNKEENLADSTISQKTAAPEKTQLDNHQEKQHLDETINRQMEVLKEIERLKAETEKEKQQTRNEGEVAQTQVNITVESAHEQESGQTTTIQSQPEPALDQEEITTHQVPPQPIPIKPQKFWMKEEAKAFETQTRDPQKESEIKKRLDEIQQQEEIERKEFLERIQGSESKKSTIGRINKENIPIKPQPETPEIITSIAPRPSAFGKFWSRILATMIVVAIFAGVFWLIYWTFFIRKAQIKTTWCENEKVQIPQSEFSPERCVPPPIVIPEIRVPPDLISIATRKEIVVPEKGDPLKELARFLEENGEELEQNKPTRIVIKSLDKKEVLGFEDFFNLFKATVPDGFYSKINKDFNLLIYPQKEGRRWGIISQITTQEGVDVVGETVTMLRLWEDKMDQNLQTLFVFFGKTEPAINDFFTRVPYGNINIRCQTFSKEDFGDCYAIKGNSFVLTTSLESIKKILDEIK